MAQVESGNTHGQGIGVFTETEVQALIAAVNLVEAKEELQHAETFHAAAVKFNGDAEAIIETAELVESCFYSLVIAADRLWDILYGQPATEA